MHKKKPALITRRQAIGSLATLAAGTFLKPTSVFAFETISSKTRFGVIGDFGTGDDDQRGIGLQMMEAHNQAPLEFVLTCGDNIYPDGGARHFAKNFEEPFAGLLQQRVKFYAALGNHDVEDGRKDQCNYPLFNMGGSCYYTISRGNGLVDFFMLDSTDFDNGQMNWLENSLRGSRAIWKIAAMHHPIYSSAKKHGSDTNLRKKLEPLLVHHRVQVAFGGHDHVYERTKPQKGIQHFVTGAGGKMRRGDIDKSSEWLARSYDQDNSFMVIEVDEREMSFQSISETGNVVDSGVIRQSADAVWTSGAA